MAHDPFEYRPGGLIVLIGIAVATIGLMALTLHDGVVIEDFSGLETGFIVAGEMPGGSIAAGDAFPDFSLAVQNHGHGPQTLIVFDSSQPTGGDPDLGTPNETCGGPGVGLGGEQGEVGENCVPLGNLLVIAEDIVDVEAPLGLIDDPDDEAGGGKMTFEFHEPVAMQTLKLVDLDDGQPAILDLYGAGGLMGSVTAPALGDNSVIVVDLAEYVDVERLEVLFVGSGGIAQIEYRQPVTAANLITWSRVKEIFRL